jgi:hypothetical protein
MTLTEEQVNDISEDLQQGFKVYINRETGETRSIYDFGYLSGVPDPWEEELNRIKKNWRNHIEIRGMEPWEVFEIMEDFVQEIINKEDNTLLHDALKDKRSFTKFRTLVEGSEYKKSWFTFRKYRYLRYVQNKLRKEGLLE